MPPSHPRDSHDDPVWRTAWDWLQRAQDTALSDDELAARDAWLRADPVHRQRYDEALRLWAEASLVPTRHVDPDPEVPLDLEALRKAFRDGGSSTS
ncbi:DUF4880 domain-containing protein [Mitsuaria sp. GD03876]|uniref:FecR/PupR family sigma factor regulator n=1 Tax=Mitsuaria sp. GD03876 TaxID=2975399 RepID=UPI002448C0F4|nr:DUF4880 domain-containing protein [Mitsuaria sp. GD03876]MDH0864401.1 DUF4880 domain-containing protein [Mitsuaria sp. GD03876]